MSITVIKDTGVTVVTLATDKVLPLMCEILKSLCYSPVCCTAYERLMHIATAVLGTIQIMVGIFNFGIGPLDMDPGSGKAFWLGGVFIITGVLSIVAGRFPSLCLVLFAVLVNMVGSAFAITAIVLFVRDFENGPPSAMCLWGPYRADAYYDCNRVPSAFQLMLTMMNVTMIVMAALQLCVCISFVVVAIKALANRTKEEDGEDVEYQKQKEDLSSPGAYKQFI